MSDMRKIAEKTFTAEMYYEGSWGARDAGKHESTMTLYLNPNDARGFIEWVIPALDDCEHIGLWFNAERELVDYDGVFSLPHQAVQMLRDAGFTVGEEYDQ